MNQELNEATRELLSWEFMQPLWELSEGACLGKRRKWNILQLTTEVSEVTAQLLSFSWTFYSKLTETDYLATPNDRNSTYSI